MEFVLKNTRQQLSSFSLAPCQRSYACPMGQGSETLARFGCKVFRNNRIDEIGLEKPVPTALLLSTSLPPNGALPKLFPTVSPPSTLSLPSRSLPPNRARPNLFPTASPRSTLSSLPRHRLPKGRQRDARAYIRPLGNGDCHTPATQKRRSPRDARGTPGRTSDPLAMEIVTRLPRKSGGAQGTPEGRQGVHPTPWQWRLPHAYVSESE